MLAEERLDKIVEYINEKGSVNVTQLVEELNISESTIRRDLTYLDECRRIRKVRGGALAILEREAIDTKDVIMSERQMINRDEKIAIAKYAASLVEDNDYVFLDAGSTTECMIEYIDASNIVFVTNALNHAKKLAAKGYKVYVLGGEFKLSTEAIVGEEAVASIEKYNFTKGFFGTNGVTVDNGYTTPEISEATIKRKAMNNCKDRYVLCDSTKIMKISCVRFAEFLDATLITDCVIDASLKKYDNVTEVR